MTVILNWLLSWHPEVRYRRAKLDEIEVLVWRLIGLNEDFARSIERRFRDYEC
jgi:hypothetical protein